MTLSPFEGSFLFLCITAALLAIGVGYGLPGKGTDILKDFLLFATGSGIAFILARAGARATSLDRVRSLCNRSVQRLGLTASRVRETADQLRGYASSPESREAQIAFILEALAEQTEVSIGDLEEMAGARIGLDPLVATALQGVKAAAEEAPAPTKEKLLSVIKTIEQQVAATPRAVLPPTPPLEVGPAAQLTIACAECRENVPVALKLSPGSTAFANCHKCNSRLRVHRGVNRQITVSTVPRISIQCPSCKNHISVVLNSHQNEPTVVRNCLHCNDRIFIDRASATVVRSERGKPIQAIYVLKGAGATVMCPNCAFVVKTKPPKDHGELKVNCQRCTSLLIAEFKGASAEGASATRTTIE